MKATMLTMALAIVCGCSVDPKLEAQVDTTVDAKLASPEFKAQVSAAVKTQLDIQLSNAIDVAIDKKKVQTMGDQSSGDRSINVGQIEIDGNVFVLLGILAAFVAAVYLFTRYLRIKSSGAIKAIGKVFRGTGDGK